MRRHDDPSRHTGIDAANSRERTMRSGEAAHVVPCGAVNGRDGKLNSGRVQPQAMARLNYVPVTRGGSRSPADGVIELR